MEYKAGQTLIQDRKRGNGSFEELKVINVEEEGDDTWLECENSSGSKEWILDNGEGLEGGWRVY